MFWIFLIVEKTFAFYEKFLFSEEKSFATFRFTIFEGRNIANIAKVSAPKIVSPKVYLEPCGAFVTELDIKKILMINFKKVLANQIGSIPISFSVMKLKFIL